MVFLEDVVNHGKVVGHKARLKGSLVVLDRNIQTRKKKFGMDLYNTLQELTGQQDFYATSDRTIATIRPLLLETDREIRALDGKKLQEKGNLDLAEAVRREAFPVPAANWKEKASNAGKSTKMAANETKLKIRLNVLQARVNVQKEAFGLKIYNVLDDFFGPSSEPIAVHCATDQVINRIRAEFKKCQKDVMAIQRERKDKLAMIDQLDIDASLRRIGK